MICSLVTGIGGLFVQSHDPKALAAWYRDVLGLKIEAWGGALLRADAPGRPPVTTWNAFAESDGYMAPLTRPFMVNFAVDDLDAMAARLARHGVTLIKRDDTDAYGRFAWVLDPEGNKVELWQPK